MESSPFRKQSLERLSTPERLDTLMQVSTPRGWLALAGGALVVVAALLWGVFGHTAQAVAGSGMLLRRGGLYSIEATGTGHVASIVDEPGGRVRKGQVVARLLQPELEAEIDQARVQVERLRARREELMALARREAESRLESLRRQREGARQRLATARDRLAYLRERVTREEELIGRGLVSRQDHEATVEQAARAESDALAAGAELERVDAEVAAASGARLRTAFELDQQILQAEQRLALLRERYERAAVVRSLFDGHVVQAAVDAGELVQDGKPLLLLEQDAAPLEAMLFVPLEGKRVRAGMRVEVSPAGVRREEYGYIHGTVTDVSDVPVNPALMTRYLRNDDLVRQFTAGGPTYRVTVRLERDTATASGYRWSTRRGPDLGFGSGTILSGRVIVREVPPIAMVIPTLRKWMGV